MEKLEKKNELPEKVVVAISARALFNLEEENKIFETKGVKAYYEYQVKNESKTLEPGAAFSLVKAFLDFDEEHQKKHKNSVIEVIIVTKNSPEAGVRIFNSVKKYQLNIERAAFLGGASLVEYLKAFNTTLYLSKEENAVRDALTHGIASALLWGPTQESDESKEVRIALDADKVIFSDESEKHYEKGGKVAFKKHEEKNAGKILKAGPFAIFFRALARIRSMYHTDSCPIKLAIVTARDLQVCWRVLRTLRAWKVEVDKVFFLGDLPKNKVVDVFKPHLFFDDKWENIETASKKNPSGEVVDHTAK